MRVSVLVLEDFAQRVGNDRNHFVALRDSVVSSMGPLAEPGRTAKSASALRAAGPRAPLPARVDTVQMQRAGILQQNGHSRVPSTREVPHDEGRTFLIASDEIVLTACSNTLQ